MSGNRQRYSAPHPSPLPASAGLSGEFECRFCAGFPLDFAPKRPLPGLVPGTHALTRPRSAERRRGWPGQARPRGSSLVVRDSEPATAFHSPDSPAASGARQKKSPSPCASEAGEGSVQREGEGPPAATPQTSSRKIVRPSTRVRQTRPRTGRPSKGAFFDFDRNASVEIRQDTSGSKSTRSAGAPGVSRPTGRRRIRAGLLVKRRINSIRPRWPLW
jgi:hypothetical protein